MNERNIAIVTDGLAAATTEICWHACGRFGKGRHHRQGARTWALKFWDLGITANATTRSQAPRCFMRRYPRAISRGEAPANGIAVKRLGRMSDVTRASARL